MIATANGYVEILGRCCYFNFISDRLRRYKGNKPQDIDLDKVTKGSTAYDAMQGYYALLLMPQYYYRR